MYGKPITLTAGSAFVAVTGTSATLKSDLDFSELYEFSCSTNCFIKQGVGAQTAAAAANNVFVPAGVVKFIHGANGNTIAVIQETAGGNATIHLVQEI